MFIIKDVISLMFKLRPTSNLTSDIFSEDVIGLGMMRPSFYLLSSVCQTRSGVRQGSSAATTPATTELTSSILNMFLRSENFSEDIFGLSMMSPSFYVLVSSLSDLN